MAVNQEEVDKKAKLLEVFISLDDDRSGFLDMNEMKKQLDQQGNLTSDQWDSIFEKYDKNKDGKIGNDEFVAFNYELCKDLSDEDFQAQIAKMLKAGEKEVPPSKGCCLIL